MKKALIITYYWPPSGGAGVQRWLKFVKYLKSWGWEPVVYTPENPESPEIDESLFSDVPENIEIIKQPIWEPYNLYKQFIGKGKKEKIHAAFLAEKKRNPLMESLSVWIRGNFFIPDARKFWINPSIRFLKSFLDKKPVDLIISTGPPHSMHLIAMAVAESKSLPWIADFRDPWTGIDFYKDLKLTRFADKKHRCFEREVLKKASAVVVISRSMAGEFSRLHNRDYDVITNGYDEDDIPDQLIKPDKKFSVVHLGSLVGTRNPLVLWQAISQLLDQQSDLRNDLVIKLIGKVDYSAIDSIEKHGLTGYIERTDYLPHADVVKMQLQSRVLLLLINNTPNAKSILTGKFFEYLAAKRPILCIGPPDGDAAAILAETGSGLISGFNDLQKLKDNILLYYSNYKEGKLISESRNIGNYSRKNLTGKLSELMNKLTTL